VAPLYIVHLSCEEALSGGAGGPDAGRKVFRRDLPAVFVPPMRTWPSPIFEGAKYILPPADPAGLFTRRASGTAWRTDNLVGGLSTDHCPFCFVEQKELGRATSPRSRLHSRRRHRSDLIHQGVVAGEISLQRWVEVTATTPARMFGAVSAQGRDRGRLRADIVIYDPRAASDAVGQYTSHGRSTTRRTRVDSWSAGVETGFPGPGDRGRSRGIPRRAWIWAVRRTGHVSGAAVMDLAACGCSPIRPVYGTVELAAGQRIRVQLRLDLRLDRIVARAFVLYSQILVRHRG